MSSNLLYGSDLASIFRDKVGNINNRSSKVKMKGGFVKIMGIRVSVLDHINRAVEMVGLVFIVKVGHSMIYKWYSKK